METTLRPKTTGAIGGFASRVARSRPFGRRRHKMTRARLRNVALAESKALINLVEECELDRPLNDSVIKDHEYSPRRVTLYDEQTQLIYAKDYPPRIADLREQFAKRAYVAGRSTPTTIRHRTRPT